MSIIGSNILAGASGQAGGGGAYEISRSVRFSSSDSAFLSRTPASSGNSNRFTFGGWLKLSKIPAALTSIIGGGASGIEFVIGFNSSAQFFMQEISSGGSITHYNVTTTAVFRDPSSWYHLTVVLDTTEATGSNRIKLWINGTSVQLNFNTTPSLNYSTLFADATYKRGIGAISANHTNYAYLDGYLADIHFIDGQALDPTSFGEFDDQRRVAAHRVQRQLRNQWFQVAVSNNSTAAALGTDNSGAGNTWTVNNISVTAGAGNDSLVDSPTNGSQVDTGVGGEVVGNYATLNPLDLPASGVFSNGNLEFNHTGGGGVWRTGLGTIALSSGKWYWEMVPTVIADAMIGIVKSDWSPTANSSQFWDSAGGYGYLNNGQKYNNASGASYGASFTTNDVIGIALDLDAGTLVFYKNGVSQGTAYSSLSGTFKPAFGAYQTCKGIANFGQRQWAYAAPAGFKALCTTNLPEPTIADGSTAMDVALYTGNGSTQTISGLNFSPDFVWIKARSNSGYQHVLQDIVRGAGKSLFSSLTSQEIGNAGDLVGAFNSDGFSVNNNYNGGTAPETNGNAATYVAWTWDAGTSTVTNTQGSITSQVRANASAGFSVVTYTGNDTSGASFGHGLGVAPHMVIVKTRGVVAGWMVWHRSASASNDHFLILNQTSAVSTNSAYFQGVSSTTVTVGGSDNTNSSTSPGLVAYCFAPVAGYSAFGSYTGNGSADGPFVYTGFRPRYVLLKCSSAGDSAKDWFVHDGVRDTYNLAQKSLNPNRSVAELDNASYGIDLLSNGFKIRTTSTGWNGSAETYIYAAFAENPFQYARAR
jgi:hypothetical protein